MVVAQYQQSDFYDILLELVEDGNANPEHYLKIAVLERAIRDYKGDTLLTGEKKYRKNTDNNTKLEVAEWLDSDEDSDFSFIDICDSLDLDPELIRKRFIEDTRPVARWSTQGRKKNKYF